MVDDQKIDAALDRRLKRHQAGIHRRADPGHAAVVGHLEAVVCAGKILERGAPGALVAVVNQVLK